MAALQQFQLYIDGKDMIGPMWTDGPNYDEFVESLFSAMGPAPASSFKKRAFGNAELSYDVTIDTLEYPTLEDYAKKIDGAFKNSIDNRTIKYEIFKTKKEPVRDVIYFTLDYNYKLGDFEKDLEKAKSKYAKEQDLITKYNRAVDKGDQKEIDRLKAEIDRSQKVEVTPITSASEVELANKAIESEEQPVEEKTTTQQQAPVQNAQTVQPVIVTPSEKTTTSSSKERSNERSIIESISSSVFDKKILQYEKSSTERSLASTKEKTEKAAPVSIAPVSGGILSESQILKDAQSIERLLTERVPGVIGSTLKTIVPTELSNAVSTIFSSQNSDYASSLIGNDTTDIVNNKVNQTGSIISSMSDAIKLLQGTINSTATNLENAAVNIESSVSDVVKESTSFLGLVPSTVSDSISSKLSDVSVKSEKNSLDNTMLADIQRKVMDLETAAPLKMEMNSLATNIGDSIKSMVTNIIGGDKTNKSQVSVATTAPPAASTNTSTVNQGETTTANIGSQTNQSFQGGQSPFPSVVSLSQSTIDNLASAIIKNMSITPFLNSGR